MRDFIHACGSLRKIEHRTHITRVTRKEYFWDWSPLYDTHLV